MHREHATEPAMPQALGQTLEPAEILQPEAPAPRKPTVVPLLQRTPRPRRESDVMNGAATALVLPLRPAAEDPWDDEPEAADEALDEEVLPAPEPVPDLARRAAAPADDATLAALLQRIVHQDHRALEALYDLCAARVFGLVQRIVNNNATAEEVVEETFWQAWRQAPRFDAARGRPLTWLLAIARSRAIDALRREQRFQHEELPEDDTLAEPAAGGQGADAPGAAAQDRQRLHDALVLLPARDRQLVSLAFLRGLTHEEIAAQQALPLGTVKSLIRRALLQLRQHLEARHVYA